MNSSSPATTSYIAAFRYQPEKIEIGLVYHYIKSNLDGTNAARVSLFVASKTHLEVVKIEQGSDVLAYVTADMDWASFSADHITSWHVLPHAQLDGQRVPAPGLLRAQAVGGIDQTSNTLRMWVGDQLGSAQIRHYPAHIYNFDFLSFNFMFRHLIDPEAAFAIGVLDPNWKGMQAQGDGENGGDLNILIYRGEAHIDYVGLEPYRGVPCRKYRLSGSGMEDQSGFIWVHQDKGHFENIEHPLADNPSWNSFKLELQAIEAMSVGAWHAFIASERDRQNQAEVG